MPDQKYTDDPAIVSLTGAEKWPMAQSGTDKYCTPSVMLGFINANTATATLTQILASGNTTGTNFIILSSETGDRVVYLDSSKQLRSSGITPTQLNALLRVRSTVIQEQIDGISWKNACRVATAANISNFNSVTVVDGITLAVGDRVLVKDQGTVEENGIYYVPSSAKLVRVPDFDLPINYIAEARVAISEGTEAGNEWRCENTGITVIGTDPITFSVVSTGSTYTGTTGEITVTGTAIGLDTPLATSKTAAKIMGSVAATLGEITFGNGSADTVTSTAEAKIINGNILLETGANAATGVFARNTSNGTDSSAGFVASNNSANVFNMLKACGNMSTYKTLLANDAFLFTDSGNISALNDNASGEIIFASGGSSTYGLKLTAANTLVFRNQYSTAATPSISTGAAAGTSPTVSIVGTNNGCEITIVGGTGALFPSGTISSITFSASFAFPNSCEAVLVGKNALSSAILTSIQTSGSTTGFDLKAAATGILTTGNTYIFGCIISGR